MKFVNLDTVIEEYLDLTGETSVDKNLVYKYAMHILKKLDFPAFKEHKIVLLDVDNYTAKLPKDLYKILQVAYRGIDEGKCTISEVVEWIHAKDDCEIKIEKKCDDCNEIKFQVDHGYLMTHPELFYGHMKWFLRHGGIGTDGCYYSLYYPNFRVITYSQSTMFGADYHVKGCLNLETNLGVKTSVQYTIDPHNVIRLNVKQGQLLIAYLAYVTDEKGRLMIPDNEDLLEAIRWYVEEMLLYRRFRMKGDKNDFQLSRHAREMRRQAMMRARGSLRMLDFHQFYSMMENLQKLEPYEDFYFKFNRHEVDPYHKRMNWFYRKSIW